SGAAGGSAYLSASGTITAGTLTTGGAPILLTTAAPGTQTSTTFTSGSSIGTIATNKIVTSTSATSYTVGALAASFSGTPALLPQQMPGGGYSSFANTGTITLSGDSNFSFSKLVPIMVNGSTITLGTINGTASTFGGTTGVNFSLVAPAVTSATPANSVSIT